jgi:nucleoside diphosphate kinase
MAEELIYVLINPYTLRKSRTGGVISRLLARVNLELVGARMFAPSKELVKDYCRSMLPKKPGKEGKIEAVIRNYVKDNYYLDPKTGSRNRVMLLLFKGRNATTEVRRVVGHITRETRGETIRDTYGDYVEYSDGKIKYFEPAVLIAVNREEVEEKIKIWARYSKKDGGLLEEVIPYKKGVVPEKTLVLIKPTSLREPSSHVGSMIDIFSKTGLFIIGARVIRMSIEQAEEFYAPIKKGLLKRFREPLSGRIRQALGSQFEFPLPENIEYEIGEKLKYVNLEDQFNKIIKFMTGLDPAEVKSPGQRKKPGKEKCLALVYQGEEAIKKIRMELGSTDPRKALPGTVRKDFGYNVMENGAHASDSRQSAAREIKIIKIEEDDISRTLRNFYG